MKKPKAHPERFNSYSQVGPIMSCYDIYSPKIISDKIPELNYIKSSDYSIEAGFKDSSLGSNYIYALNVTLFNGVENSAINECFALNETKKFESEIEAMESTGAIETDYEIYVTWSTEIKALYGKYFKEIKQFMLNFIELEMQDKGSVKFLMPVYPLYGVYVPILFEQRDNNIVDVLASKCINNPGMGFSYIGSVNRNSFSFKSILLSYIDWFAGNSKDLFRNQNINNYQPKSKVDEWYIANYGMPLNEALYSGTAWSVPGID